MSLYSNEYTPDLNVIHILHMFSHFEANLGKITFSSIFQKKSLFQAVFKKIQQIWNLN